MPLPDRPVAGADIETEWGQYVHDYVFAPSGARCTGGGVTVTTSRTALPIDTATEDPGGYVDTAANNVEVPTGGEGLYDINLRVSTVGGATTSRTRVYLSVNGSDVAIMTEDNEGGTAIQIPLNTKVTMAAGDIVTVAAVKRNTGTDPTVNITELTLVRIGSVVGA